MNVRWPHSHHSVRYVRSADAHYTDKVKIVEQGNYHKFTISDDADSLRAMLLATGKRELVEASPSDRIWGIGFVEERAEGNRRRWGDNLLGLALTSVRKRLVEEGKGE